MLGWITFRAKIKQKIWRTDFQLFSISLFLSLKKKTVLQILIWLCMNVKIWTNCLKLWGEVTREDFDLLFKNSINSNKISIENAAEDTKKRDFETPLSSWFLDVPLDWLLYSFFIVFIFVYSDRVKKIYRFVISLNCIHLCVKKRITVWN